MEQNLKKFISVLKSKTTKQSNKELYELMTDNINDAKLYKKYKDQLIINNVRLVIRKVREYIKSTKLMLFDDLVQEGIIGLIKSIDSYDKSLGYNFSTWASIHVKKHILRFMDSQYMPKPHTQITENINRVRTIQNKLFYKLNREPTPEEVKKELDKIMKKKSRKNKRLNKKRLKDSLTPLSEQIGVNKEGKFVGIDIDIIRYIINVINNNLIMHTINLEQYGSNMGFDNHLENSHDNYDSINDKLIGNVLYKNMYEEAISLISELPIRHGEIVDMLLGISYERPYTLEEIRTVLYNPLDNSSFKYTIPLIDRLIKMYFNKLKRIDDNV